MAGRKRSDWDAIIQDLENGMGRKEICDKHKIEYKTLSKKISRNYPHLVLPRGGERERKSPPRRPKHKPTACLVMLKIDVIGLFNKKIPIPDIAKKLSTTITQVNEILACAKKKIMV